MMNERIIVLVSSGEKMLQSSAVSQSFSRRYVMYESVRVSDKMRFFHQEACRVENIERKLTRRCFSLRREKREATALCMRGSGGDGREEEAEKEKGGREE